MGFKKHALQIMMQNDLDDKDTHSYVSRNFVNRGLDRWKETTLTFWLLWNLNLHFSCFREVTLVQPSHTKSFFIVQISSSIKAISDVLTHFKNEFENQYNTIIELRTRKLQSIMTPEMLEVCVDVTLVIDQICDGRILLAMEESSTINKSSIELLEPIETDERNNNDDCLVCLDEIGEETQVLRLPCSHMFHGDCITKWLENSHYCRFEMPTD
ncbi:hypothetical protein R3W88_010650 [Solanum pinnatisectum]|uniref:RING-type E3 ubiquitin transferase n=1 Tax=Solanum pinnatisectum TaxID=50273 RepID=A0AAV9L7X7_9SOLN|nr:hypothetical protein R3W88_010650 [Solanum pinnatisectum]